MEDTFECIGTGENFLKRTPKSLTLRWNLTELKSFCKAKTSSVGKIEAYRMRKDLNNPISYRGIISKTYKELKKLDIKKSSKSI